LRQVGDDAALHAARHNVPGVCAFDFVAHADAARTQDAAVVIHHEALVRGIHREARVSIGEVHVGHAQGQRHGLQVAVAVGDADAAHVVAFGEHQFQNAAAELRQALRIDGDFHALRHARDAGRQQFVDALDFDDAQAASAGVAQPGQIAQRRDEDVVLAGDFENGLIAACAALAAVDGQRLDADGSAGAHFVTSSRSVTASEPLQVPAGQPPPVTWASYSSRKYFSVVTTGLGALCPSPHKLVWRTSSQSSSSSVTSAGVASPAVIFSRMPCSCWVPARHGMHLPQDSLMQNSMKYLATSTMQDVSSMTIMPPEPMMEPMRARDS